MEQISITIAATEVDGSITNEGSLTVGVGTSTTSLIQSNTWFYRSNFRSRFLILHLLFETGNTITISADSGAGATDLSWSGSNPTP